MHLCNKILTTLVVLPLLALSLNAQNYVDMVKQNKEVAAGVYHPYVIGNLTDTPAPKGYHPFYISHFGRHGSRYHTTTKYLSAGTEGLEKAMKEGLLNEKGKQLYAEFHAILKEHEGMEGQLSPLGAREHRGVASRMYHRFPEVFNNKSRNEVDSKASVVQRCIISMANFTTSLKDEKPSLQFTFGTGDRYMNYLAKSVKCDTLFKSCSHFEDSLRATCKYDKLMAEIFNDPQKGIEAVGNPQKFIKSIYFAAVICPDLDFLGIDLFKYFDPEELAQQWICRSDKMYGEFGNSREWGAISSAAAKGLVNDFVTKADEALKDGSHRAADLRFGHDTGILPLYGLIGIKGMDERYPMARGHEYWNTYKNIPMCSNFQMIFYKNKKGDVLVKLLVNEEETVIPALATATGPYYKWEDLRNYLTSVAK